MHKAHALNLVSWVLGIVLRRSKGLVFSYNDSVIFGGPTAADEAPVASSDNAIR